jgi:hypothetical protein
MSSILRSANNKGSYYGDASYRTAYLRKQAIVGLQIQKTVFSGKAPDLTQVMSTAIQAKKPLISEHHLTKGSTNGSMEFIQIKNKSGIF